MPSILSCAELCKAVYSNNSNTAGWSLMPGGFKASGSGITEAFQGACYKQGDDIVFAFKGTTPTMARDLVADAQLGAGMNTFHYAQAGDFVDSIVIPEGSNVYLTGHSLGGAIAQVIGNRHKLPFITFNAPGVGLMSRNVDEMAVAASTGSAKLRVFGTIASAFMHPVQAFQDLKALGYTVRGANLRLAADAVSLVGVHFGRVVTVENRGESVLNPLKAHSIDTFVDVLKLNPAYSGMRVDSQF